MNRWWTWLTVCLWHGHSWHISTVERVVNPHVADDNEIARWITGDTQTNYATHGRFETVSIITCALCGAWRST